MKKAKNFADGEKKKAAKARELALRQKKEDEDREKVLEEAKKIVVEEDLSLPSKRISLWDKDQSLIGQRVRVFGRAHRVRKQAHMVFIELRDGYGYLQVMSFPSALWKFNSDYPAGHSKRKSCEIVRRTNAHP